MENKVSIVIPSYNGRQLLEKNLPAILKACRDCEVIVVDDASTDDSVDFLRKNYPQIKLVTHQKNQRFAAACNSGVKAAQGEVVVLLNNDVSPQVDFLKPLLGHFADPQVFAVGCKERDYNFGKKIDSGRGLAKFHHGFLVHWRAKDQNQTDTFWAAGGSLAVNRQKYLKIEGMDPLFRPAYWEDIDLSWRARKKGWKVVFEPKSIVFHHHETTNITTFGQQRMKTYAYKNQFLFLWKNAGGKVLISHLFWMPYHLFKALVTGDWLFWQGLVLAVRQLPELLRAKKP